jgi:hypothetical protein
MAMKYFANMPMFAKIPVQCEESPTQLDFQLGVLCQCFEVTFDLNLN